jgi:DNA mismatch repair protein MutS
MENIFKQYKAIKDKYKNALLLFRVGEFFKVFGDDAIIVSKVTGKALTNLDGPILKEVTSIPLNNVDVVLQQLVKASYRVAICEELEEPKKKTVKRSLTDLLQPK